MAMHALMSSAGVQDVNKQKPMLKQKQKMVQFFSFM